MISQRQARKALKQANQKVGILYRDGSGWNHKTWFQSSGKWVAISHAKPYRDALARRKRARIGEALVTLGLDFSNVYTEAAKGGRSEAILARASRLPVAELPRAA